MLHALAPLALLLVLTSSVVAMQDVPPPAVEAPPPAAAAQDAPKDAPPEAVKDAAKEIPAPAPAAEPATTAAIPTPESHFGFKMGDDFKLATWDEIVAYLKKVDDASDRVLLRTVGQSTEGRPFIILEVSAPENLARRDEIMANQRRLAAGRTPRGPERRKLLDDSRFVVFMNCNLHSNEIASSLMVPELVHQLATTNDPRWLDVLAHSVLVIAPSANPDGIDKVVDWYRRHLGTPYEGSNMPWLYQTYVGHDNNRDWFMLSQIETQHVTRVLYKEWLPAVVYDVHQMGNSGVRYFVPPFTDPVNPNLDPLLQNGLNLFGTFMANELSRRGKTGVAQGITFDNWWDGGARNVPYRHNMIGILTEAASANLASPVFQRVRDLKGHGHALPEYKQQTNFLEPWPGGWWRLRDIIEYELISVDAILRYGTRFRREVNANYHRLAERAIARGGNEAPYAFIIPADQADGAAVGRLLKNLDDTGVEIHRATKDFEAGGSAYKAGTWIVLAAQPYRAHAKDLLERQDYPEIRAAAGGEILKPYDNAGWTLPMQFGIRTASVDAPFSAEMERVTALPPKRSDLITEATLFPGTDNDTYTLVNRLLAAGAQVQRIPAGAKSAPGGFAMAAPPAPEVWDDAARDLVVRGVPGTAPEGSRPLRRPRVGLYQPWTASMDEGWTRFVLEQHAFDVTPIHNDFMRYGALHERFDAIILPSVSENAILNGAAKEVMPSPYHGGIGGEGRENLRAFVEDGGTLIAFASSTTFVNHAFGLGLVDETDANVKGLSKEDADARKAFSCPGSILRAQFQPELARQAGIDERWPIFYDGSPVYAARSDGVVAVFANEHPLMSGYLNQPQVVAGKAAMISRAFGKGRLDLFFFRPQNRGQSLGTFRLIFNALFNATDRQ